MRRPYVKDVKREDVNLLIFRLVHKESLKS